MRMPSCCRAPRFYGIDRVYVIGDDDILEERVVRVVASARDTVTIASGILPGERVVSSPLRGAGEGDKVLPTLPLGTSGTFDEDEAIADSIDDAAAGREVADQVSTRGKL